MAITILYAPQPDERPESSAAYEYAKRSGDLMSTRIITIDRLGIESLKSHHDEVAEPTHGDESNSAACKMMILIISCSADGSVDRMVRKILRQKATTIAPYVTISIALLGHAKCDNSAKQMEDTIFYHGRKFHRFIESMSNGCPTSKVEVQVELEDPEARYDEWMRNQSTPGMYA
mmetsp:Transcript_9171/g.14215  ORF Transcript_9171/g.14215 Transcript_9171/m.14215 type:complete len:175 (+) Transcript_9171:106-630(+)